MRFEPALGAMTYVSNRFLPAYEACLNGNP